MYFDTAYWPLKDPIDGLLKKIHMLIIQFWMIGLLWSEKWLHNSRLNSSLLLTLFDHIFVDIFCHQSAISFNRFREDNPFYQHESGLRLNRSSRYRETINFFSSNSCNFITATSRAKNNCPKGYVFCKRKNSSKILQDKKMTFAEAVDHCENLNSTICKFFWLVFNNQVFF